MINWEEFNSNFQYYGNELICEIIDLFELGEEGENNDYQARLDKLSMAIGQEDFFTINRTAHSLKSVIGNFYDPIPVALAGKIMELSDNNIMEGICEAFNELKPAVYSLAAELAEYRKQIS